MQSAIMCNGVLRTCNRENKRCYLPDLFGRVPLQVMDAADVSTFRRSARNMRDIINAWKRLPANRRLRNDLIGTFEIGEGFFRTQKI